MSDPKLLVLGPLCGLGAWFVWFAVRSESRRRDRGIGAPHAVEVAVGALTNFFDTLGIGSFATTTSTYRLRKMVPDRLIPGTLNVGHALPTVAQALIYIAIVDVDLVTLSAMIASAVLGAFIGADVVAGFSERKVRIGMAFALFGAAALMLLRLLGGLPAGGDARGVAGLALGCAVFGNFALGALMTLGIGLYGPCMVLVSLLGMSPKLAFPIMMGSCAFLMPVASAQFMRKQSYAPRAALGLALGGVPAVLIAAYLVKELPLDAVRWLVVVVVIYTAVSLLRAARARAPETPTA